MITTKQRAFLRSKAQTIDPVVQIGKDGLVPECTKNADEALEARELIKVSVQKNCFEDIRELADTLAQRTHSDVVQVIGRKFVLYRYSKTRKTHIPLNREAE